MENKWVAFFLFIYTIGTLMMVTYDGLNTPSTWESGGYTSGNMTAEMSNLQSASVASQKLPFIGSISYLVMAADWLSTFYNVIVWNFSFVQPYPLVARILNMFAAMGLFMFFRMLYSAA